MAKNRQPNTEVLDVVALTAISQAVKALEPSPDRKAAMRARIFNRLKDAPPPEGTATIRAGEGGWIEVMPLVEMKLLRRDPVNNNQTALWRLKPGAIVPCHAHRLEEECWVVEGEIKIGDHYVRQGDMHIAQPGYDHPPIESACGALLLVRAEISDQMA